MASQWTIPKLVTWRVKDWASCFLACKIPIDVDEDAVNNNSNTTNNNLMFKRTKRKIKKKRSERKLSLSPPGTRHHHLRSSSSVSPTSASHNRRLSLPQPPASDEPGFIVFCFDREDGGFDVVKEGKEERREVELSSEKSPKTVHRKLIYGDQGVSKEEKINSLEIKETEHDQADKTICQETENVSCGVHDPKNEEEEDIDVSDKSSGSNHSDEGRGSFAFPILGVEWMGSPVLMPTPDDLSPKKQKPIALGFQCCRF
ncbi:Protein BREAKING OF ASYMMETRY IN THE STOMATAL LINEAGE [Raphanus sativus]|uniref:Protein BREAKING OF ASYMMETRY IN THE STOMATAL LINEAGE isoform X1 n=1 Tax=Raphanus sativus TaxID=3726 RepID=A0A6J0L6P9_RAPSA|nr:protein BREAKING OF ASYMMETRY IN THE STOMATAL LINEAGE isoform X1 [Raphanus sativus]XP_056854099.1 protein BREAKING OF ASYMMETRY IN THE STOMATAL LINEAGE-like isoform X1 [Raphanus sativus]KAJ4870527.1 Protein BREAKING OF ASYMMETRY IN THE STOMATAL LINEAGE [Raphanus sativus]KAJ4877476.1 Protein BREAKING OF ASYMMETRY IN THE STOMATAL LINEAGE [Raphanus sativus]